MTDVILRNSSGNVATLLILDADGLPKTAVAYNAAGLAVYYTPKGGTPVQITLSAGNWTERVHGLYEVAIPDAAYTGTAPIRITGVITDGVVIGDEHLIIGYDRLAVAVGANTTTPPTANAVASATRSEFATELGRIDTTISSRSTFAGGAVASVTNPVTVGTNNDKTGYTLSAVYQDSLVAAIDAGLLDAGDATDLIASIVARIGNTNIDEASLVGLIKAALFDAGSTGNKLIVNADGQVEVSNVIAPDNAGIIAIQDALTSRISNEYPPVDRSVYDYTDIRFNWPDAAATIVVTRSIDDGPFEPATGVATYLRTEGDVPIFELSQVASDRPADSEEGHTVYLLNDGTTSRYLRLRLTDVSLPSVIGTNAVAVHVQDLVTDAPIELAEVRMYRTGESATDFTDADGDALLGGSAATWGILIRAAGYRNRAEQLVVAGDREITYTLEPIPEVTYVDAATCLVTVKVDDQGGAPVAGAVVSAELSGRAVFAGDSVLVNIANPEITDENGIARLTLIREREFTQGSGVYKISIKYGIKTYTFNYAVPDQDTALATLLLT